MTGRYEVEIQIGRQEDGLWRVEVPGFTGCFVDAPTLEQAIAEIQEVIAMAVDEWNEEGWALPPSLTGLAAEPHRAVIPVVVSEHRFTKPKPRPAQAKRRKL